VFIPVPNAAQVSMRYLWAGQKVENVFGVRKLTSEAVWDTASIFTTFRNFWIEHLKLQLSAQISLTEIAFQPLDTEGTPGTLDTLVTPIPGNNGASVPNNVAFVVTLRTGSTGRSYRGRSYVPGLPRDSVTDSRLQGTAPADIVACYNALIGDLTETGAHLAIISKYHNKLPRVTGVATDVTVATFVDNVTDSQRRRLPGRGK
jgi:hypothetical protein